MADESNELFMRMVDMSGNPILAECRTEVTTDGDDLIPDYFNGEFFAVDDFSFGLNIEDEDALADAGTAGGAGKSKSSAAAVTAKAPKGKFGKWKSATPDEIKAMKFQLKMDDLSITRRYDRASPVLFQRCARSEPLQSASLVKRKVVGSDMLQTFLRYDFKDVLVTHISFQDADVLKETVQMVFRELKIQYRPQSPDGTMGAIRTVQWKFDAKTRTGPDR